MATGRSAWDVPQTDRQWRYVVLHHSATDSGSAAEFDKLHRRRGWDELGYHFVITNGKIANGLKHSFVMVLAAWVVLRLVAGG